MEVKIELPCGIFKFRSTGKMAELMLILSHNALRKQLYALQLTKNNLQTGRTDLPQLVIERRPH